MVAQGAAVAGASAHVIVADVDRPSLAPDDRRHLEVVLRLRPGQPVSATDGSGAWRLCRFALDPGGLEVAGDVVRVPAPAPAITVAMALVKGERPEWAVQKLVELGVDRVVLFHAGRSVVRWTGERAERHVDRLRAVARQALMQSRQVWLPEVSGVEEFGVVVAPAGAGGVAQGGAAAGGVAAGGAAAGGVAAGGVALAAPGGAPPSLDRPAILIGPEGGWTPEELACGLPTVSLGMTVLRTETAAVTAGALLAALRAGLVAPL